MTIVHARSATADAVVSDLPNWAEWPALRAALSDDPNVAAAAPRVLHYGMLTPPGRRPPPAPLPGKSALHGGDQTLDARLRGLASFGVLGARYQLAPLDLDDAQTQLEAPASGC